MCAKHLRHVRFVGGSSGSGKSTLVERLAVHYGLRTYSTDPLSQYVHRTTRTDAPLLHAFLEMGMDERWVSRSPEDMLTSFHGFQGETFHLIVEDLVALPKAPPIIAEGFALLPHLVAPLLSAPHQAVWLAATPDFRREAFRKRRIADMFTTRTSDPERALENLLLRDALFDDEIVSAAEALGLTVIRVDGSLTVEQLLRTVSHALDLLPFPHSNQQPGS